MIQQLDALNNLLLDSSIQKVLIIPHSMPDGDTIGSSIGVCNLLEQYDKEGYIVLNDDIPSNLCFLIDETVTIYKKDQVSDLVFDAIFAIDSGELKMFEDRLDLMDKNLPLVVIDHHITNQGYGNINVVAPEFSSTAELVYFLFEHFEKDFSTKAAEAMYTGIVTDTGSFRYSNTRPYTFKAAAALTEKPFDFNRLNVEIFQNKPFEKMVLLNKIADTLELYYGGKCAVVTLSESLKASLNLTEYDTDGVVEYVRDIRGVEVVVFIRQLKDNLHKVSMRSKNDFDVAEVALVFEGGGHKKAAGFKMDAPLDTIKAQILNEIEKVI